MPGEGATESIDPLPLRGLKRSRDEKEDDGTDEPARKTMKLSFGGEDGHILSSYDKDLSSGIHTSFELERGSATPHPAAELGIRSGGAVSAVDITAASNGVGSDCDSPATAAISENESQILRSMTPRSMMSAMIAAPPLGYCILTSWEEIVKSIDYVYWDFGNKMQWICTLSTSSTIEVSTAQLAKMCPEKFARFLDRVCSQGCEGINCGAKVQFVTVPSPARDETYL